MTTARVAFAVALLCLAAACASAAIPADSSCVAALKLMPGHTTAIQALLAVQARGEATLSAEAAKACAATMDSAAADAQAVAERVKARAAGKPLPPRPQ